MSGTKANPQDFESLNRSLKRSVDLRDSTKAILRASEKWNDAGRSYAVDMTDFAEKMLKFVTFVETNEELVTILRYFGKTMKAISQEGNQMMERCGREFSEPLAQFIENDFIATAEAKKRVDKAMAEYESTLANVKGGITKHNAIDQSRLIEFTQEMERLREGLNQKRADLASRLDKIDVKVEQKLLSYLYDLMASQHQYFIRGCEIFKTIKPRMDQMKLHIEQVAATREKEVVSTKEGYLLQMNDKSRVKSNWIRNWYVLRDGLFYCKVGKEVDNDSVLDIVLCTVRVPARARSTVGLKEAAKHKFEIMTPGKKKPIVFAAETEGDRKEWVAAIQEAISQSLNSQDLDAAPVVRARGTSLVQASPRTGTPPPSQSSGEIRARTDPYSSGSTTTTTSTHDQEQMRYLNILRSVPGNDKCADCRNKEPEWASINLGILICLECSGVHRSLGTHISKVRSLTLDKWDPELLIMMKCLGNTKSNQIFEATMSPNGVPHLSKITPEWRKKRIKAKYVDKIHFNPTTSTPEELSEELYSLVSDKEDAFNVARFIMLMYQGANVNWPNPNEDHKTPLHRAVELDNIVYVEALTQNGGSPFLLDDRGWTAMHYAAYFNHLRCLSLLLKRGCKGKNDLLLDTEGRTTLQVAEQENSLDCEQLLLTESMYTPKAREANGGQHHDKNGGRKTPRSGSGSEISVDSQDEATGDGSQDVSDGETDAVGQRNLELDLRSRTLMTVEDVEKERWRDCLQHFLTLPKKELPEVTDQSRKLALVLREPQKSKSITLSGSEIATRNQSWASDQGDVDDSVRSSSGETKVGSDTKRTRRLSLNLSLISAVHKGPSRKSGRENGACVAKPVAGKPASAAAGLQSQSLVQLPVTQKLSPSQSRGVGRAATVIGLTGPASPVHPNPGSPAQPWLQEDYWEDSSKTSSTGGTDEECEEEDVERTTLKPVAVGLRKANSVDALPISPKNDDRGAGRQRSVSSQNVDDSDDDEDPKRPKLHASMSALPTASSQSSHSVVISSPTKGRRSGDPASPKTPGSSPSSPRVSSSPPRSGPMAAALLNEARKERKTKKPGAASDVIAMPNSSRTSSPRHGSPPSPSSPLAAMSHRSASLRSAIGDLFPLPSPKSSSGLSGSSPPDQRRPSSLSKATARKAMTTFMSSEKGDDGASSPKMQGDRKVWKKEESKLDHKRPVSMSFDKLLDKDYAIELARASSSHSADKPPSSPTTPTARGSATIRHEPPPDDASSTNSPTSADRKNKRKTFLGFAMTK